MKLVTRYWLLVTSRMRKHTPFFFSASNQYPVTSNQRGFTLLLAALVASIVLALGSSIFEIASKEVTLSAMGRDSQFAFYAADQGAECALYWDLRFGYFATSAPSSVVDPDPRCDGQSLAATGRSDTFPYTMTFTYSPHVATTTGALGFCVNVAVEKTRNAQNVIKTTIHSDGFSTSCASQATSPRALQRSVELHY